jgi:hypothetical protein
MPRRSTTAATASDPVREWLESGRKLAEDLKTERQQLKERLRVVEDALMRLSAADAQVAVTGPTMPAADGAQTLQTLILSAIENRAGGASLADIRESIQATGKKFEERHLASYVYRLQNKLHLIEGKGKKGHRIYTLVRG